MQTIQINSFLENMFTNQILFNKVNGVKNIINPQYMLIADAVGEHIELFSEIIKDELHSIENKKLIFAKSESFINLAAK
jgi:hypothetical protein